MNKIFANIIAQFKEFYRNLTPIKRASVLGSVIVASGTLVIISLMVSGAHYKPLLKDIPADQLPLVIGQLEKNNIPFKMEAQGNTISVPENLLHASQMVIMAQLGPSNIGSIGLELFEKQDFGVTSYAQRINYQRALQGELTRAINTLSSVKRSKVILALAPKKTFLEESAKTTASVVLELYPGKHLQEDQVRGITYLVASSVEGLEPEEVTVVDSRGKVLSKKISGGASESADLMEVQRKMEMDLESRVEAILSKAVGAGKVIAKINVKLNPNHVDTVQELVDPDQTAVLSSVTEEEKLNGARSNPVGIPGARANLPGAGDQGQVGFKQDVNKELKTTNYQVSKTVKKIRQMSGNIEKISAAILIDGTLINETDDKGNVKQTWQQRTPEEIARFENLVKNAIGFSTKRGDEVKIENMQFQQEDFTQVERDLARLNNQKLATQFFKWSLILVSLGLIFLVIVRPFIHWITDSFQDSVEDMLPRTIEELEELQTVDNSLPGMTSALPMIEETLDPEKAESELLKERIQNLIEKNEEKAANAFGMWLVRKD